MLFNKLYPVIFRPSKKLFSPCGNTYFSCRYASGSKKIKSALYLPGSEATSTYAVLSPYLNFNQRLNDGNLLDKSVKLRGLNIDLSHLSKLWFNLKDIEHQRKTIDIERKELTELMKKVSKSKNQDRLQELQSQGKKIKKELKNVTQKLRSLEEEIVPALLDLPNDLHSQTIATDKTIFRIRSKPTLPFQAQSHVTIGKTCNQLEILDCSPTSYYLKNELAVLELAIVNFFSSILLSHGYSRQCNPDFTKSVVVDGCGFKYFDKEKIFTLEAHESDVDQSCLHLTGGSSLASFASYFTKQVIQDPSNLPLKLFSVGRNYIPKRDEDTNLLNCSQTTSVDAFIAFENKPEIEEHMIQQVLMAVTQCYAQLHMHFRIVRYGAQKLEKHESGAIGIEMHSPVLDEYYQVGRISICGSYISERLWCMHNHHRQHEAASFLSMIHVRVCQVTPWLALLMENSQLPDTTYDVPKVLEPFMLNVKCKYF
ncbi:unnamed protein product [Meganyctiphanes norvegica]|uniref:Aminoacyl-tRNA synthetase class II (G/ P/ S/T) domain-containing protein n=1 Tax=Meganyctiphanes norvegica TaxID=48144 RepID=A0AAV2S8N1_MEGNR